MSFARSVLQSKKKAMRSIVARSSPATSTIAVTSLSRITHTSKTERDFWTTAPVEQQETATKEPGRTTTQKEIVKAIAETHDLTLAESKRILSTVFDTIVDSLVDKKTVRLANFGTFETYTAKAFTGRNPRTGDAISVPPKERCRFRPHETFKKNLSGSKE